MPVQQLDHDLAPSGGRRCRVRIGAGLLERLADDLAAAPPATSLFVVSDSRVAPLYAHPLVERLRAVGLRAEPIEFPEGEASKSRDTKSAIEDRLFALGAGRDSAIVAVGGGVTGDLAGFVAATWHRGIPVVQVPTSLLAMVDAALGGKTAVNLPGGKNLVGAFWQPWGVWADVSTLRTLPDDRFREGFAEAVKSATIADAALFDALEQSSEALLARDADALVATVGACLRIKRDVVLADEREAGPRAMLNFGHTVAHALESCAGYELSHGRAVAIGLCVEGALAVTHRGFPGDALQRVERLLACFGLPRRLPAGSRVEALVAATRSDKKRREDRTRYALPAGLGCMPEAGAETVALDDDDLRRALSAYRADA
jgi:3-dehydroquinate synthase